MRLDTITLGDARELSRSIPDESIDLIFTDPPYDAHSTHIYEWLGKEAARVLKPDKWCFAYSGNLHKYEAMMGLGLSLDFYWDYVLVHKGGTQLVLHRFTTAMCKSILCFVKRATGQSRPYHVVHGLFDSERLDKRFHKWGQSTGAATYYIECFTRPGDLIWEPFAGGGTTPYVCKQIGRHFIASEIDPLAHAIAVQRLQAIQPRLFVPDTLESVHLPGID